MWKPTLTNGAQKPYSRGGDNIMSEAKGDGQPQKPPEGEGVLNNAQRVVRAAREWKGYFAESDMPWEKVPLGIRGLVMDKIKMGERPPGAEDKQKKEKIESQNESPKQAPKTEAGGSGGGKEPPKKPPTATGGGEDGEADAGDRAKRGEGENKSNGKDSFESKAEDGNFINKDGVRDPIIAAEIDAVNNLIETGVGSRLDILINSLEKLSRLTGVNELEKRNIIKKIKDAIAKEKGEEARKRENTYDYKFKSDMQEIMSMKDSDPSKEKKIMNLLKEMTPHTGPFDPNFIGEVIKYDVALDYLVNRIVAQPLDAEQSEYRLSFYGGINLDQIKDILKTKAERGSGEAISPATAKRRYQKVLYMAESAQLFHTMNLQIITGNLEQFVNGARAITPEQLQMMQNVPGVAQVMRLFDAEIFRVLNRDGIITNENYNEIMGLGKNKKTGEVNEKEEGGVVERRFRKIIKSGTAEELNKLEDWQIKWAFNVGKIMGNLSLRTAEQISLSKVPGGNEQYASIPQESAARLMNWVGWTGLRFNMAKVRGGVLLTRMASKIYQKDREIQGFDGAGGGRFKIKKMGWEDIEDFELAGMFGVTGVWSSWRQNLIILNNAPAAEKNSPNFKTIGDFLDEASKFRVPGGLIDRGTRIKQLGLKGEDLRKVIQREQAERLREVFLLGNGELNDVRFNNALGLILKNGSINGSEKDLEVLRKAKEDVRSAIWRKVAEDNPLAILPYLLNTELVDGTKIKLHSFGEGNPKADDVMKKKWDDFSEKLTVIHEIRMQSLKKGRYISFKDVVKSEFDKEEGIKLNEEEGQMLREIERVGKSIDVDLANVRFPNNPFMNDVMFEEANYSSAGAEFYRRRAGGDLASFHSAGNEFAKLMMNPGGTTPEEAFKTLKGVVEAIGSPNGTDAGQDKVAPFLQAYLTFISKGSTSGITETGENIGKTETNDFIEWLKKDNLLTGVQSLFRQPTSLAQKVAGLNAPALDEFQIRALMEELLKEGITRKARFDENGVLEYTSIDDRLRKRVRAGLLHWLFAILRDLSKVAIVGAASELIQQTTKENK